MWGGAGPAAVLIPAPPGGLGPAPLPAPGPHPWGAGEGSRLRAHEFHYSTLAHADPGLRYAFRVERGEGTDGRRDGIVHRNVLATYAHQRSVGGNDWVRRFLRHVAGVKAKGAGASAVAGAAT